MEYKNFTAGYFDGEINFCIENLPRKFIENIPLSLFLTEKIYRVDSKIIISDEHLKQLVKIIGFMHDEFSVKEFKDKSNLSRKYAIPYLELLDKIGVTQKIDKAGSRKKL